MNERVENVGRELKPVVARGVKWWTWQRVLLASVLLLVILEVGTYAFNWTWTGFKNNDTLWDWMSLLILPLALAAVPIWFGAEEEQQRIWLAQLRWLLIVSVVILVVLFAGTYAFNWTWTGFKDHGRLWDWLQLLLVPALVAALPIWYSLRQSHGSDETSTQQQHRQDIW